MYYKNMNIAAVLWYKTVWSILFLYYTCNSIPCHYTKVMFQH